MTKKKQSHSVIPHRVSAQGSFTLTFWWKHFDLCDHQWSSVLEECSLYELYVFCGRWWEMKSQKVKHGFLNLNYL